MKKCVCFFPQAFLSYSLQLLLPTIWSHLPILRLASGSIYLSVVKKIPNHLPFQWPFLHFLIHFWCIFWYSLTRDNSINDWLGCNLWYRILHADYQFWEMNVWRVIEGLFVWLGFPNGQGWVLVGPGPPAPASSSGGPQASTCCE